MPIGNQASNMAYDFKTKEVTLEFDQMKSENKDQDINQNLENFNINPNEDKIEKIQENTTNNEAGFEEISTKNENQAEEQQIENKEKVNTENENLPRINNQMIHFNG